MTCASTDSRRRIRPRGRRLHSARGCSRSGERVPGLSGNVRESGEERLDGSEWFVEEPAEEEAPPGHFSGRLHQHGRLGQGLGDILCDGER